MNRAVSVLERGSWSGDPADSVELDREDRARRRCMLECSGGLSVLLDLPAVPHLQDGDGLELEDGRIVLVKAAPEDLTEITARDQNHLIKIAWHLGNRHLPTQLLDNKLRIRRDHVIENMVRQLGGTLTPITAPFDPEGGAYGHGHTHGHSHDHDHAHA